MRPLSKFDWIKREYFLFCNLTEKTYSKLSRSLFFFSDWGRFNESRQLAPWCLTFYQLFHSVIQYCMGKDLWDVRHHVILHLVLGVVKRTAKAFSAVACVAEMNVNFYQSILLLHNVDTVEMCFLLSHWQENSESRWKSYQESIGEFHVSICGSFSFTKIKRRTSDLNVR